MGVHCFTLLISLHDLFLFVSVFTVKTLNEGEGLVATQSSQGYQDGIHDMIFIPSGHRKNFTCKKKKNTLIHNLIQLIDKKYFRNTEGKICKVMAPTACIMCSNEYCVLLYSMFYVLTHT